MPRTIVLVCAIFALILAGCASSAHAPDHPSAAPTPITRGDPARHTIALTFDTGAGDAGRTREILDALQRQNVRATFAVTGLWAENNRDLLLAIAAAGHQIINGGYHGTSFTGASTGQPPLTASERASELSRTEVTVYHLTQRSTRPEFRPPYGDVDDSALRDAAESGYPKTIMWTVDASGDATASADSIAEKSITAAAPGAIYRMTIDANSQDAAALPHIIDGLRAQGYTFATIDDLLRKN